MTITFSHRPEGLYLDLLVTAEFDAGDRSVGINPGWWFVEAELDLSSAQRVEHPKLARMLWDRDSYELMFGSTALRVVEENAADIAQARIDEREEEMA